MKSTKTARIVLVTVPNARVARRLAQLALKARLAACVNIIPGIESHYWWQGKLETGKELLLIFKTDLKRMRPLEELLLTHHPYDTAEFVVLPVSAAAQKYLNWWLGSLES